MRIKTQVKVTMLRNPNQLKENAPRRFTDVAMWTRLLLGSDENCMQGLEHRTRLFT